MTVFAYECSRRELKELAARRPVDDKPPSTEDVHRMRIAMRRLRVALRLFRRMLPREAKEFRKGLRAFARALSDTRDLDVHADVFRTYAQAVPAESLGDLGGYELHLRRERTEARAKMIERFSDDRYDELLDPASLLEDAPSPGAARRWHSFKVSDGVDKYLKKSVKRVLKLGRKVGDEAHAKDLHRLRIRAKRLRYELEFFALAYKSLDKAALEAKALQDLARRASRRLHRVGAARTLCTLASQARARADARSARSPRGSGAATGARRAPSVPAGVAPLRAQRRTRPSRDLTLRSARRPGERRIDVETISARSLPCRASSSYSPSSGSRRYTRARKASPTPPTSTRI